MKSLTQEQHKALTEALAEVGLKLEAAFGPAAIVIVAQSLEDDQYPGVISNLPPHLTVRVLQHLLHATAANTKEHVVPMKVPGKPDA